MHDLFMWMYKGRRAARLERALRAVFAASSILVATSWGFVVAPPAATATNPTSRTNNRCEASQRAESHRSTKPRSLLSSGGRHGEITMMSTPTLRRKRFLLVPRVSQGGCDSEDECEISYDDEEDPIASPAKQAATTATAAEGEEGGNTTTATATTTTTTTTVVAYDVTMEGVRDREGGGQGMRVGDVTRTASETTSPRRRKGSADAAEGGNVLADSGGAASAGALRFSGSS